MRLGTFWGQHRHQAATAAATGGGGDSDRISQNSQKANTSHFGTCLTSKSHVHTRQRKIIHFGYGMSALEAASCLRGALKI